MTLSVAVATVVALLLFAAVVNINNQMTGFALFPCLWGSISNVLNHPKLLELEKIMMKIYPLILWICMIAFYSCSTVRVSQDYRPETDFSNLKTYRWQPVAQDIQGDEPMDDPLRDERIQKAVERNLHALGFRDVTAAEPDFFIDFQYSVYRVMESNGVRRQVGIGRWGGANETFGGLGVGEGGEVEDHVL